MPPTVNYITKDELENEEMKSSTQVGIPPHYAYLIHWRITCERPHLQFSLFTFKA